MNNPMAGLDAWLEAPYTNRAREEAAFEEWCEREGVDPSDPGPGGLDAWESFERAMEDEREDAMIAAAEARAEEQEEREG